MADEKEVKSAEPFESKKKAHRGHFKELCHIENQLSLISGDNAKILQSIYKRRAFWYRRHAQRNKWLFLLSSSAIIIINAAIALISGLNNNLLLAILSISVIVIRSFTELFFMRDNWKRYRSTLERMGEELDLFNMRAGDYEESEHDKSKPGEYNPEKLLIKRIVGITSNENMAWEKQKYKEKGE